MTKEQKEVLTAWRDNLLVTYRLDFFRGRALRDVVRAIRHRHSSNFGTALLSCHKARNLDFEADTKDYTELLNELRQIAKKVPLSDAAQEAITHIFGCDWDQAEEAIMALKSERNA